MGNRKARFRLGGRNLAALALILLSLFQGCGTEVPDETDVLAGRLVDENHRPVAGIVVLAIPDGHQAAAKLGESAPGTAPADGPFRTLTDRRGRYQFDSLQPGAYFIRAVDTAGNRSLFPQRRVLVEGDRVKAKTDTLYPNGTLTGVTVQLPDFIPRTVYCTFPDKPYVFKPNETYVFRSDSAGRFNEALPPGDYVLLCDDGEGPLVPTLKTFTLMSGATTELTIGLPLQGDVKIYPPAPTYAEAEYDSVTGLVRLQWSRVEAKQPIRYWVMRIDSTESPKEPIYTSETSYINKIAWLPSESGRSKESRKTVTYIIGTEFVKTNVRSEAFVTVVLKDIAPPIFLGPEVSLRSLGAAECAIGDTVRLVGEYNNRFRINKRLLWFIEETREEPKPPRMLSEYAGSDTLAYACAAAGSPKIRFTVEDESGATASDYFSLTVKPAP